MFEENLILYTKNGKLIGNSIIIECLADDNYIIKTDYGSIIETTGNEIKEYFNLGVVSNNHKNSTFNLGYNKWKTKWKYVDNHRNLNLKKKNPK